ncbi:glycosyltransferase [Priestia megaterium]|uniref:glycosyltransferase n=1 Tax=Priestia megaterium TaxID=1404 RepID=UPI003D08E247
MSKVLFFDTVNSGHHFYYNYQVMKGAIKENKALYVSSNINKHDIDKLDKVNIDYLNINSNLKNVQLSNISFLAKLIYIIKKNKIKNVHLLYVDSLLIALLIFFPIFYIFNINLTSTLHWVPGNKVKRAALKFLLKIKVIKKLVVHGQYSRNKLLNENSDLSPSKIVSIPYPYLHTRSNSFAEINLENNLYRKPFLLAFGGLRYDKGIDILLRSLKEISNESFTLLIVGKESYYTKKDIIKYVKEYSLENKVFYNLEYVTESELNSYFNISDVVILPYRKVFSGQSGPLTEAVARSKFVIGPRHGEIGFTIENYGLGMTFEAEDYKDLSVKIKKFLLNKEIGNDKKIIENQKKYQKMIDIKKFREDYLLFFNEA